MPNDTEYVNDGLYKSNNKNAKPMRFTLRHRYNNKIRNLIK